MEEERFGFLQTTLKADSSTLNSESDPHKTNTPPTIPSAVALSWICSTTRTMLSTDVSGNVLFSSVTRKLDSSARPKRPSSGERQEQERHEREQREVGDHRREVGSAVVEELGEQFAHAHSFDAVLASRRGDRRKSPFRADRHLLAGAGCGALRRRRKVPLSTLPAERAEGFAAAAKLLWEQAEASPHRRRGELTQLEATRRQRLHRPRG